MNSLKHAIVLALAILAFALLAASALGRAEDKSGAAQWENLRSMGPGSDVRVALKNVQSWEGRLREATGDGLTIQAPDGTVIGVSGSTVENDHAVADAGAKAALR